MLKTHGDEKAAEQMQRMLEICYNDPLNTLAEQT